MRNSGRNGIPTIIIWRIQLPSAAMKRLRPEKYNNNIKDKKEEKTATKFPKNSKYSGFFSFWNLLSFWRVGMKIFGSEGSGSYLCKLDEIPKCDFKKSLDPLIHAMTCFEFCNFTGAHHYIHNNHIAANEWFSRTIYQKINWFRTLAK